MQPADASHLVLATAVIVSILGGAIAIAVDAHRNPFCKECYHCLKAKADRDAHAADVRHRDYHYWDRGACLGRECPGLKAKKR